MRQRSMSQYGLAFSGCFADRLRLLGRLRLQQGRDLGLDLTLPGLASLTSLLLQTDAEAVDA